MKRILLTGVLLIACAIAQAIPTATANDNLSEGIKVVAKRLASKNLTEVVVIAIELQMECQQLNTKDVCEGVKSILAVLDARVASLATSNQDSSVAFVMGLMEGVNDANQESMVRIKQIR